MALGVEFALGDAAWPSPRELEEAIGQLARKLSRK